MPPLVVLSALSATIDAQLSFLATGGLLYKDPTCLCIGGWGGGGLVFPNVFANNALAELYNQCIVILWSTCVGLSLRSAIVSQLCGYAISLFHEGFISEPVK